MTYEEEERALKLVRAFNQASEAREQAEVNVIFSQIAKCVNNFEVSITLKTITDAEGQYLKATLDKE